MARKPILIAVALVLYLPLGLCGADALAGAVFTLANKRMPEDLSLTKWPTSWQVYGEDPIQRKRLQLSAAVGGFVWFGLPVLMGLSLQQRRKPLHGEARFASPAEIQQAGLYGERGVIIGKVGKRYLIYGGQEFVLLAAPTRSGKGVSIVLPNLLHYDDSVVVLDIKMENLAYTSKFRQAHGHHVYLFNPFGSDGRTHRWNPLDAVDRDPNRRVGEILAIAQVLYPTEHVKDAFWNESARNLFLGLTLSIMETPSLPCSLGEVLRQASGKGQPIKDYLQDLITTRAKSDAPLSDDCTASLYRFCAISENTMAGILATLTAPLTIFSNPLVDAATSATDFDLKQVRAMRMSIYVGIPANRLSDAALLVNLFFSQLIHYNTVELPATNPRLKHKCLVILDEFPAIGRVNILAKAVGFMASYNLRLLPIIQSLSQLESVYGEKDARTFVTNHACQILFAPREQRDAQHYSQTLGTYTADAISTGTSRPLAWGNGKQASSSSTHSELARPLLLPQEVKELGDQRAIIDLMHTKPILCEKARFYADPIFIDRLKTISPTLAAVGRRMPTQAELEEAAFVRRELAVEIPQLDLELHRAKVEQRVRPLRPNESVDVSQLAIDPTQLPPVVARDPPAAEEVTSLVDAFFSQLQWADKSETARNDDAPEGAAEQQRHVSQMTEAHRDTERTVVDRALIEREEGTGHMTISKGRGRQRERFTTLVIGLVCAATISCAPKPVVPSGANRVPINSDEMINQYRERVKIDQRQKLERSVLTRHMEALTQQVQDLSASVTVLQLQQQELAKGRSRSSQKLLAAFPSISSLPTHERSSSPTNESPLGEESVTPLESVQILSSTQAEEREEQRVTSASAGCRVGGATETPQDAPMREEPTTESWKPRMVELGEREQVELHRRSVIFRLSQRKGRSEFRPSKTLQAHLKQAMKLGHCLQVRGYTDGEKDQWIERATATQRAQKARAYLIRQGVAPDHIQVTVVPIGEHVADNATKQGRAKNRRVEIEVKEQNPATVWPQWYG